MIEIIYASGQLHSVLFVAGAPVHRVDIDQDLVIYRPWGSSEEEMGTLGEDVKLPSDVSLRVALEALATIEGRQDGRRSSPTVFVKVGKHHFCRFANTLCRLFYKSRGYRAHYAPVSTTDAEDLVAGRKVLKYIKGSSRFRLVDPNAKNTPKPKSASDMHVGPTINWWMEDK